MPRTEHWGGDPALGTSCRTVSGSHQRRLWAAGWQNLTCFRPSSQKCAPGGQLFPLMACSTAGCCTGCPWAGCEEEETKQAVVGWVPVKLCCLYSKCSETRKVLSKYGIIPPDKGMFEFCSCLWLLCETWTVKHLESRQDTAQSNISETLDTNSYDALHRENYFIIVTFKSKLAF